MRLEKWEGTIQEILDECKLAGGGENQILMKWRAKLEKEPTLLRPFQIDEIIREVRQRLDDASQ